MGKCLVTKLNGVVNNNNLKKIGVLKIPVAPMSSSKTFIIRSVNGSNGKVTITDKTNGKVLSVNVEDEKSSNYSSFQVPNGGYVEISDKYSLIQMELGFNIASKTLKDYVSELPTIDDYRYCKNITSLSWNIFAGNVSDLAEFDSLEDAVVTYLTGDVVDYISARIAKGFSQGKIYMSAFYESIGDNNIAPSVKINGVIPQETSYQATYKSVLKWESINKYYWLVNNQSTLYVHGYTDEEIEGKKGSGLEFEHVTSTIKV